jgi:hypothetical protein
MKKEKNKKMNDGQQCCAVLPVGHLWSLLLFHRAFSYNWKNVLFTNQMHFVYIYIYIYIYRKCLFILKWYIYKQSAHTTDHSQPTHVTPVCSNVISLKMVAQVATETCKLKYIIWGCKDISCIYIYIYIYKQSAFFW